jgi:CTD small phosphatase-like protein 2
LDYDEDEEERAD